MNETLVKQIPIERIDGTFNRFRFQVEHNDLFQLRYTSFCLVSNYNQNKI